VISYAYLEQTLKTIQRDVLKNTIDKSTWNLKNVEITHKKIRKRKLKNGDQKTK